MKTEKKGWWKNIKDLFFDIATNEGCMYITLILVLLTVFGVGYLLLTGLTLMVLWNWLAPLFWNDAPEVTYWQSVGIAFFLTIIGGILRGGITIKNNNGK